MRARFALGAPLVALVFTAVSACGGTAGKTTSAAHISTSASSSTGLERDSDGDFDHTRNTRYDLDDNPILYYGHAAGTADAKAIGMLVRRYYADAAAGDGRAVCTLIFSVLAEALPEQYAGAANRRLKYGDTCASVVSRLFELHRQEYLARNASLRVTGVRVEGDQGFALLSFKGMPDEHLRIHREAGRWTLHQLLDEGLP
jgi:hypothetical protein